MAEKRMFSKLIIDSDAFLEMPLSTQALYFHLSMRADDEGFINNPKRILKTIGGSDDDIKILIAKNFIIPFEDGVVVIKHWKLHNCIRKDRIKQTVYQENLKLLDEKDNGTYTLKLCQSIVSQMSDECQADDRIDQYRLDQYRLDQYRLDQIRLDKVSEEESSVETKRKRFTPPTVHEVKEYCLERNNNINPQSFIDFYESKGWKVGNSAMKDWKAAIRTWENRDKSNKKPSSNIFYDIGVEEGLWTEKMQ